MYETKVCESCIKIQRCDKYIATGSSVNGGSIFAYFCNSCFLDIKQKVGWTLDTEVVTPVPPGSFTTSIPAPYHLSDPPVYLTPCGATTGAKRYDTGVRMDLLIPQFLIEMGKIMSVGEKKYGELNWQKGGLKGEKGGVNHALQHIMQYMNDDPCDYGPRHCHLAQVAVNAMFEWWHAEQEFKNPKVKPSTENVPF